MYTDRAARQGYGADRSNLAYDYNALERRRVQERPTPHPQVRTIRRPKVNLRPAEQVSVSAVLGFLVAGAMLVLVLMSSVVSLQKELTTLQTENVTLTTAYERAFDLETVESAARAAGMSKPSTSQIYYLDSNLPDSASVYTTASSGAGQILSIIGDKLHAVVEYFT